MVALPRVLDPFINDTDPDTVPAYSEVTVAVNVTVWPSEDGFGLAVSVVPVVACFTTWVNVAELLVANVASPPNDATNGREPAASVDVVTAADPLTSDTEAMVVEPFLNMTFPVGTPAPDTGATVAVRITD